MEALLPLVVICVLVWLGLYLITIIPTTEPGGTVLRVLVVAVALVWVLVRFGRLLL